MHIFIFSENLGGMYGSGSMIRGLICRLCVSIDDIWEGVFLDEVFVVFAVFQP